ncbi:hypothetical protein [uncultured Paraglaciecola sp.]|uniref:hypothetical protein n=1 Tax=uncultured Paraglaciecola sp. TaxID=1765024 RepID=UPI0030D88A1C|tara:strand:+ start:19578 stop:20288 length:711 start_codon:yes stop_codon:yes gene_type:complete
MILRAYLPKFLTALFGGLFVAASIFTFGNALVFDRLFLGVILFTAILCRKDVNVLSVIAIIFLQHIIEEFAWLYLPSSYLIKGLVYITGFWLVYYFWYDWTSKILLLCLILGISTEVYWYVIGYEPPQTFWYVCIIMICISIRHLVFLRVSMVESYISPKAKSINLDWVLYKINAVIIIAQTTVLFEYYLRHIFGFKNALFAYEALPYIIHALSTLLIWTTFNESYKQLFPQLIKA